MKTLMLLLASLQIIIPRQALAAVDATAPRRVRVGVDIRVSYQSCIDFWTPITEHLSHKMPDYRFVIVPIASQQDLVRLLGGNELDFVSLDPAMEILAEDRFGVAPLATIVESLKGDAKPRPAGEACSGAVIRRADRTDIQTIKGILGRRVIAVRPWSLTGWISQWGLFVDHGIDPQKDLKQVAFLGTHGDVIENVLDGNADVGAVDAEVLFCFASSGRIPQGDLHVFNQQGLAVPLDPDKFVASTTAYPGRFFSKTAAAGDELAKRVADALMQQSLTTTLGGTPCTVSWTNPSNTSKVRRLLYKLIGPHFAESSGYPPEYERPAWLYPALVSGVALLGAAILLVVMRGRYARRADMLKEQLQSTQRELAEVRAEWQRINAILAMAGCGIDIIDEQNRIIYADAGLERKYGDWHGRKCHNYYCNSNSPCSNCKMPTPADEQRQTVRDIDGSAASLADDPHAKVHFIEGEATRMIGIPFRDESGCWLYARIHFPLAAMAGEAEHDFDHSAVLQT